MSSKTILISRSVFRCGRKKSVHGRPSWKLAITAMAITLDSGLRLLLLHVLGCQKQWSNLDNQVSENSV